jgi:hypothetical protein
VGEDRIVPILPYIAVFPKEHHPEGTVEVPEGTVEVPEGSHRHAVFVFDVVHKRNEDRGTILSRSIPLSVDKCEKKYSILVHPLVIKCPSVSRL